MAEETTRGLNRQYDILTIFFPSYSYQRNRYPNLPFKDSSYQLYAYTYGSLSRLLYSLPSPSLSTFLPFLAVSPLVLALTRGSSGWEASNLGQTVELLGCLLGPWWTWPW